MLLTKALVKLSKAIARHRLAAERASVVCLEPLGDTLRMEVMRNITRKWSHLIVLLELDHADAAFLHFLKLICIVLLLDNRINYSITFILLILCGLTTGA